MSTKTKRIRIDDPGVVQVGPYRRGEEYTVPEKEAERLIRVKGFREVREPRTTDKEDAK